MLSSRLFKFVPSIRRHRGGSGQGVPPEACRNLAYYSGYSPVQFRGNGFGVGYGDVGLGDGFGGGELSGAASVFEVSR